MQLQGLNIFFFYLIKASKEVGAIGKVRLPKFHFCLSVLSLIGFRLLLIMPQMDTVFVMVYSISVSNCSKNQLFPKG